MTSIINKSYLAVIFRKSLLALSLLYTVNAAFAEELTSTVQVFNALKWDQVRKKAQADPRLASLQSFIEILYDPIVGVVRWEYNDYIVALNERWTDFRKNFCPLEGLELCAEPELLKDFSRVDSIINILVSEKAHTVINQKIADTGMQLTRNLNFPGITKADDKGSFSLRIAEIDRDAKPRNLEYWEIRATKPTQLIDLENAFLYDLTTYALGYTPMGGKVPAYFALDEKSNGYLQIEKIKMAAMDFAQIWRHVMKGPAEYNAYNIRDILLHRLYQSSEKDFEKYYGELKAKLTSKHQDDIDRFEETRAKNRYPLEVYQAVSYDLLLKLTTQQVEYYEWAQQFKKPLNHPVVTTEALLNLQKIANPELFLFLVHRIATSGEGEILDQTVHRLHAQKYLLKFGEVLRGKGKYKTKEDVFSKLIAKVDYKLILNESFLENNRPLLYAFLEKGDLLTPEKLKAAPIAVQKQVIDMLLSDAIAQKDDDEDDDAPNTKPNLQGILHLSSAIFLGADKEALDLYQTIIFNVNQAEGT